MARHSKSAGFATSLIVGLLLIPVSAVAAYAIVSGTTAEETSQVEVAMTMAETTTTAPTPSTTTAVDSIVVEPVTASADDLDMACGADGYQLVEAEAADTISDVQQAALDALRQVCADAGLELPGPPEPDPIVRTVSVQASPSVSVSPTGSYDDDHDEYEYEDHEDDDDHDEYEDHEDERDEEDEHDEYEDED